MNNSAGRNSKKDNVSVTRNNEVCRINVNLETEQFNEEKESKYINSRIKDIKNRFPSSNTSDDLNLSNNKNLLLYNIHKNNSSEVLELKNLEESVNNELKSTSMYFMKKQ